MIIMTSLSEDLKFHKREKQRIKSEINDLESRIIVAGGRPRNRHEVNNLRERLNLLKGRLNEVSLRIVELEKMSNNENSCSQIQVIPNSIIDVPSIDNGEITITDTIVVDSGSSDRGGEIIETIESTLERKIVFKGGKPVSSVETLNKTVKRRFENTNDIFIESSIVD